MTETNSEYKAIPLHLIDPPRHMMRMSIDEDKIKELVVSIQAQGLLQPLVVKPREGRYEVSAGHRRLIALNRLGFVEAMCHVKDVSDKDVAINRTTENVIRANVSPIEEAKSYKELHEEFNMSLEEIADRIGKTPGTVKRRIDLLLMPQEAINAMHDKKVSVGVVEALCAITDRTAFSYYLGCAIDNGITVLVARQWASDWKQAEVHKANDVKPGDSIPSVFLDRPCYVSCDTCGGPSEIKDVKMIRCCPACMKNIIAALKK